MAKIINTYRFIYHRYEEPTRSICLSKQFKQQIRQGYCLSEIVAACHCQDVLLMFYRWQRLKYEAIFVLADMNSCGMKGFFNSPKENMSVMECKISPDSLRIAVLFYYRKNASLPFQYDLYLFSMDTFDVVDIIPCNTSVRPYISFDPRYGSSRLCIVNYSVENEDGDSKSALVQYCVESHEVVAISSVMVSVVFGGGYFGSMFTKDGRYLVLQKISDTTSCLNCYADTYIFDAGSLKLLKHYSNGLQPFGSLCRTNFAPHLSLCGSRMCIVSDDNVVTAGGGHKQRPWVSVYQLPRPFNLQEQCRISILQSIKVEEDIQHLPLPQTLKYFLRFSPSL